MKTGTVLVEPVSGIKLLVIEPAIAGFNPEPQEMTLQGRQFVQEEVVSAGKGISAASITCDPGDRSRNH